VASKISMAIPAGFALFVFNLESKTFDGWNYAGLILSLVAIVLTSVRSSDGKHHQQGGVILLLLPVSVFFFNGLIDTILNYTNHAYLTPVLEPVFPVVAFISAGTVGTIVLFIIREPLRMRNLAGGALLGVINYFSIYFLIKGLSAFDNDGALFFPIFSIGIISGAALVSVVAFKERLKRTNLIGLIIAFMAIVLIAYQELLNELL